MSKISPCLGRSLCLLVLTTSVLLARQKLAIALPFSIRSITSQITQNTNVPVLLPSENAIQKYVEQNYDKAAPIYAYIAAASSKGYNVRFSNQQGNVGNVAFIFSIRAERSGNIEQNSPDPKAQVKKIRLADASTAFVTVQCGAGCWSIVRWKTNDVLYEVWTKSRQPNGAIEIANSAIQGGDRRKVTSKN